MQHLLSPPAHLFLQYCRCYIASAAPRQYFAAYFSTLHPEESALKKTLLKYRANASKSRDKAVKQAYMQLANDIQTKLNLEAAATKDSSRSQDAVKPAAAVEVALSGSGAAALKFRLPSSFKPAAGAKSNFSSRKP
jgi:hypothetical protein